MDNDNNDLLGIPEIGRVTLLVNGRVRRGQIVQVDSGSRVACEGCDGCLATIKLVSKRGLTTWLCGQCRIQSGEPMPPSVNGTLFTSVQQCRSACALGQPFAPFKDVERWVAAKTRWDKATRPHGFMPPPPPKANYQRAIWNPYWQPSKDRR